MSRSHRDRRRRTGHLVVSSMLVLAALVSGAISTAALAERVTPDAVRETASASPHPPSAVTLPPTPAPTVAPTSRAAQPTPQPTPRPSPVRHPVDVNLVVDPEAVFAHQLTKVWCAPSGVQMVLAILGQGDTSDGRQREIASRIPEWATWADSHRGGWGPTSIARALAAYGAPGYVERVFERREDALRAAAVALIETDSPVILLAWRGAHVWVMTGYRADADPRVFRDATISGTYILDPWYPRDSSIWGRSDPPGTFQDGAEVVRNFLPIKRPEGRYPGRDGKFLIIVPTIDMSPDRVLPARQPIV